MERQVAGRDRWPTDTLQLVLSFADITLRVCGDRRAVDRAAAVVDFLGSHFALQPVSSSVKPDLILNLHRYEAFRSTAYADRPSQRMVIRRSSAASFNLWGLKSVSEGEEVVHSPETCTAVVLRRGDPQIDLFLSKESTVQAIELVRDLVIKMQELRGRLILHGAAVEHEGKVLLLVGSKGAGQSTLLLDLAARRGLAIVSGDKIWLEAVGTQLMGRGWPDMPHLGHGTISGHSDLRSAVERSGVAEGPPDAKVILSRSLVDQALGLRYSSGANPVCGIILPCVSTSDSPRLHRSSSTAADVIRENIELSVNNRFMGWHSYIERRSVSACEEVLQRICGAAKGLPVYEHSGPDPIDDKSFSVLP